ncbi:McrB family protein [Solibacillus sp. NPDC093137]|uniref:McrB family protein n=1 Tax=Solibacillus sp. NPDC093137 TaxID=3390678 RepID=UPI003D03F03D
MELEKVHEEVLKKFQAIQGEVLIGRVPVKGTKENPKIPKDEYVSDEHILHDLIRGFYKPGGKKYLLSYLATESQENYGKQIDWLDEKKYKFKSIIMHPPSGEKDNRKFSDIEAARFNLKNEIPIGILYRIKDRHNAVLGLGKIVREDENGYFIVEPFYFDETEKKGVAKIMELKYKDSNDLISHIQNYITSKGFIYSEANIKNLYLSLRSKPFVIISGISGTGKTKIVQLFAESLGATEENGQFTLIPVRPDWSDSSELLGYTDIKGDFIEGPLAKVVREAANNLDRPYFVLLDEMNLARVEYYFSEVLSIMESRKKDGDTYTSSTLIEIENEKLTLPNNLYIIGTVNMDETTHPFSKKVLDRANTIEFNEIHLNNFSFLKNTEPVKPIQLANSSIEAGYIQLKDCYDSNVNIVEYVSNELTTINKIIEPLNAHVGYRVRDEICFYMVYNDKGALFERDKAFDYCLMQKILPRLAGSGLKIRTVLEQLYEHLTGSLYTYSETFISTEIRYPLSGKKVHDMMGRLGDEGFTSFWIS